MQLRRNLFISPPKRFHYRLEMTAEAFVYFGYRMEYVLRHLEDSFRRPFNEMYNDACYCLDSQVDAIHRSYRGIEIDSRDLSPGMFKYVSTSFSMPSYDYSTLRMPAREVTIAWSMEHVED